MAFGIRKILVVSRGLDIREVLKIVVLILQIVEAPQAELIRVLVSLRRRHVDEVVVGDSPILLLFVQAGLEDLFAVLFPNLEQKGGVIVELLNLWVHDPHQDRAVLHALVVRAGVLHLVDL